jgi:hypothetical protein
VQRDRDDERIEVTDVVGREQQRPAPELVGDLAGHLHPAEDAHQPGEMAQQKGPEPPGRRRGDRHLAGEPVRVVGLHEPGEIADQRRRPRPPVAQSCGETAHRWNH